MGVSTFTFFKNLLLLIYYSCCFVADFLCELSEVILCVVLQPPVMSLLLEKLVEINVTDK